MKWALLLSVSLCAAACGAGDSVTPVAVPRWQTALPVCHVEGLTILADLVRPAPGAHLRRALLFVHGGAWSAGSRTDYAPLMQALAERGYTGLSVDYRLSPLVRHPQHLQDLKCALRWLQGQAAALEVDPDRVAVVGGSAGGHLAALLAFTSGQTELEGPGLPGGVARPLAAAVVHGGPHDLSVLSTLPEAQRAAVHALLGTATPNLVQLRAASPVYALPPGPVPPVLILHGELDQVVPPNQARKLEAALQGVGATYSLHLIPGAGHADFGRDPDAAGRVLLDFLSAHLQ